nr:GGDEF domain-containing protein [Zobellella iuensis]
MLNARRHQEGSTSRYLLALMPTRQRDQIETQLLQARRDAEQAAAEKEAANQALEQARRQLTELNQRLAHQAETDPLTGVFNRRRYEQELARLLARFERSRAPFSLLLADIDHFKRINDSQGHDTGDRVLQQIAGTMQGGIRELDCLARVGGEEFAILLPDTLLPEAVRLAERQLASVARLRWPFGPVTVSIGLAQCAPGDTQSSLFSRADGALYRAKEAGRNRIKVSPARD